MRVGVWVRKVKVKTYGIEGNDVLGLLIDFLHDSRLLLRRAGHVLVLVVSGI